MLIRAGTRRDGIAVISSFFAALDSTGLLQAFVGGFELEGPFWVSIVAHVLEDGAVERDGYTT
jgi:hypothetical protein